MKCICNGKTRVLNTVVKGEIVERYRICTTCGKKIKTIEADVVRTQNERFVLNRIKDLIVSLK